MTHRYIDGKRYCAACAELASRDRRSITEQVTRQVRREVYKDWASGAGLFVVVFVIGLWMGGGL